MSEVSRQPAGSSPLPLQVAAGPEPGEFLGPLLRTLAESLDVREIFARISAEARRIVPHDFLMLGLLSEDRQRVRVVALCGGPPAGPGTRRGEGGARRRKRDPEGRGDPDREVGLG